jgi:hypothetical protein
MAPDLNLISVTLSSINGTITVVRGWLKLDRELDRLEQKAKLVGVLDSLSKAQETIIVQRDEIVALQAKLNLRVVMEYRGSGAYWDKETGDGPFCHQCWESSEKRCHLQPTGDGAYVCKTCGNEVGERRESHEVKKARSSLSDFNSAGT